MGAAWSANNQFPWETPRYIGGIENVKINITLRIYANKWHVYAGLAILNPDAQKQIKQYAESVTELFKLMLAGNKDELSRRVYAARDAVFGGAHEKKEGEELLLRDDLLDKFSLGDLPERKLKNNHLSLLAIVDCWWKLGIVPYDHMICSTPVSHIFTSSRFLSHFYTNSCPQLFRMWLGITESLFRNASLLEEAIDTAINDNTFRADDLEFTFAARDWSQRVSLGHFDAYREKFEGIQKYFEPRFPEATKLGNEMIRAILERSGGK